MVFKDCDLIDVGRDKKATQSSLSPWSLFDDAARAVRNDLAVADFAFHTGFDEKPFWCVDLEQEFRIDLIKITNRTTANRAWQERLRDFEISLSADGENFIAIDPAFSSWQNGLGAINCELYGRFNARFVKI